MAFIFILSVCGVNEQVVDLSADFRLADVEVYKKVRTAHPIHAH